MQVDNKPGVLAAIASVFGVHKVSISKVIQKRITDGVAELVIVTEPVSYTHLSRSIFFCMYYRSIVVCYEDKA